MPNWDEPGEEYPGQNSGCSGIGPCACPTGDDHLPRYAPPTRKYRRERYGGSYGYVDDDNGNSGFAEDFDDYDQDDYDDYIAGKYAKVADWDWDSDDKEVKPKIKYMSKPVNQPNFIEKALWSFVNSLPKSDQYRAKRIAGL
jgi:hypothetical protein